MSHLTNVGFAIRANCANFQVLFYLPLYFQSIKGDSAIMSGVYALPFLAFYAIGAVLSGAWIGKTRRTQPLELVSPLLAIVGAVLLYTMDVNTSKAWFVGAQIPFGFGIGLGNLAPVTALQAFSKPADVAATTGIIFSKWTCCGLDGRVAVGSACSQQFPACQTISGAYFNTAAQSLFENRLHQTLARIAPAISGARVDEAGAQGLHQAFSGTELTAVIDAYMVGIKDVFAFAIAGAIVTALLALTIPTTRLPSLNDDKTTDKKEAANA